MPDDKKNEAIKAALESNWPLALKLNTDILQENPDDVETQNRLGRVYLEMGNRKKAHLCFRKSLKLDKYNPIALKNLGWLAALGKRNAPPGLTRPKGKIHYDFIEEPGKTKIANLVNLASPTALSSVSLSSPITLLPRRRSVAAFVGNPKDANKIYLGTLPDDIGHRLRKLIAGGNVYEAFLKTITKANLAIFIREVKRSGRFHNVRSFPLPTSDYIEPTKSDDDQLKKDDDDESRVFDGKIAALTDSEESGPAS